MGYNKKLAIFVYEHNVDIMVISEIHFTNKNYAKIPHYIIYDTKHPLGK